MVGGCGPAFSPSKWRCGIRVQRRLPGGGQHAQLANSVRSLASSWALSWASSAWDIAAVTGLDASLKERSAIVWAKICELLPAVLSTFSGHANRLSPPTSRQPAQTSSRGPSQPPLLNLLEPLEPRTQASHHMHLLTNARKIASPACVGSASSLDTSGAACDVARLSYVLRTTPNACQHSYSHCPVLHSCHLKRQSFPRVYASRLLANVSPLGNLASPTSVLT
jgi:hypothetical protein